MAGYDDIRNKYKNRIKEQMGEDIENYQQELVDDQGNQRSVTEVEDVLSSEYKTFVEENLPPQLGLYEQMCNFAEKTLKVTPKPEQAEQLQKHIDQCHLNITPAGAASCALVIPLLVAFGLLAFSQMLFFLFKGEPSMFFAMFSLMMGMALMIPLQSFPEFAAQQWRLKSSSQMVQCIFYIVTYMRHTSNLEHAIDFGGEHLNPPLAIDLKKVLWDVEMGKFQTIKDSLDNYLEQWKEYNLEFVEAFHLIEASLYEGYEDRRIAMLDKSLDVILDGTFEKMMHFAQNLKGPVTMLNMMGVIMPVLGLVILPLVVTFMEGVGWYHIAALYNILLPIMVYYMGMKILSTRPTGYGDSAPKKNQDPNYQPQILKIGDKEIDIKPFLQPAMMFFLFFFIALTPILIHVVDSELDICIYNAGDADTIGLCPGSELLIKFALIGYRIPSGGGAGAAEIGPFGLGATLLSLMLPLGAGLAFASYYSSQAGPYLEQRNKTKKLEDEFSSALFQLGNRIGDGLPAEIAFSKVSEVMDGTDSGKFFDIVTHNLRRMGLGLEDSIFNEKVGALVYYPSTMIRSSMKVLVQSSRKGPEIASNALLNIARYIKEIHRVDERVKDLMAEVVGSINSQIAFLTPVIAGIVLGITSMISAIIGRLLALFNEPGCFDGGGGGLLSLMKDGVPAYYFGWVVGLYVVQITFVLTIMMNSVQNGSDSVYEKYLLGVNLKNVAIKFTGVSLGVIFMFNLIAAGILGGLNCGP